MLRQTTRLTSGSEGLGGLIEIRQAPEVSNDPFGLFIKK